MVAPKKVEITHRTIVFTVFFLVALYFLYFIRDIIFALFVAVLIMAVLNPIVTKLEKYKIPRGLSILLTYVLFISLFAISIAGIVPPLIEQSTVFVVTITKYFESIGSYSFLGQELVKQALNLVGSVSSSMARLTIGIVSNLALVVTVLFLAFYLLLSRKQIPGYAKEFADDKGIKEAMRLLDIIEKKLGGWMLGQASLMLLIGLATYIGLSLLGVPFALPLAIFAGLLEIVPYLGPIISAIPMIIIGFSISGWLGIATLALAILIQQAENYIFVPKVMQKSTGVHPIVVLVALAVGAKMAGILGILLAVPVVITARILLEEYWVKK